MFVLNVERFNLTREVEPQRLHDRFTTQLRLSEQRVPTKHQPICKTTEQTKKGTFKVWRSPVREEAVALADCGANRFHVVFWQQPRFTTLRVEMRVRAEERLIRGRLSEKK